MMAMAAFECPAGETAVQKRDKQVESNGCSKPDFLAIDGEEDFTYCCDRHDTCYAMCGASKSFCENDFDKCMKTMCKTTFRDNDLW
jgi:Group XII secretory phospholipase A2 precursor (PLA2G12)